ncbi:MAG: DsbA family protein [Anaerolineae bacterium]|nr:DsbA family protein [Anaerolineae bacterium]
MNRIKPLYLTLMLIAVFGVGVAIGFMGRPVVMPPAEVVVTVMVTPAAAAAAQAAPPAPSETIQQQPTPTIMDFLLADARHFLGDVNAPVTVVEFSDFRCGFCGRWAAETLPQLRQEYIDPGQVRFTYKHLAILGPDSVRAAEASECAAEQGEFWDFHNQVFVDQAQNRTSLTEDNLVKLAGGIGLDMDAFRECLTTGRYTNQVMRESQTIQSLGVQGTPGFLVNGVFISGAQPFAVFQQVIEEQLAAKP